MTGCPRPARDRHDASPHRRGRGGFTVVELLVVVAIIIALLSIVIVAMAFATRSSQRANTAVLMNSIHQGLVRFKEDLGYYPPVLGYDPDQHNSAPTTNDVSVLRHRFEPPSVEDYRESPDDAMAEAQDWYSITSLAEYLIGWDERANDGYGDSSGGTATVDSEIPRTGIRNPSADGIWQATKRGDRAGLFSDRNPPVDGRRYGPYIDLKDDRLLAVIDGTTAVTDPEMAPQYNVYFAGEAGYDPELPRVIVDYWGNPIHYYRRPYKAYGAPDSRTGVLTSTYRPGDAETVTPSLADILLLRPQRFRPGQVTDTYFPDDNGDTSVTFDLSGADIGLFSPGPDRLAVQNERIDDEGRNADNIIEVGP